LEETDGDARMVMQRADQEVMKDEVLKLQLREAKARRRAKERQPGRSKEQSAVRHYFLAAAYATLMQWTTRMEKETPLPPTGHSNT